MAEEEIISLTEEERVKLREACKRSMFFLCRAVIGFKDFTPDIHKPICEKLQDLSIKRVIIVMPRTWFKSSTIIGYMVWRAINDPNYRSLVCQNSFSNATKKLYSIKQIFENNALFRCLFPELLPKQDNRWSSDVLVVNRTATHPEGTFEAAGTGTAVTSRHYDDIIEDDTVSPEKDSMGMEMQQPTAQEIAKAIGWHNLAMPLLVDPGEGRIIIVGTRWGDDDLIGHVMKNFPGYEVITRAVREKDGEPCSKSEGGLPAWPARFGESVLKELETAMGPYMFATLMMNLPTSAANQTFRRQWIRFHDSVAPSKLICCTSVDPAASDKESSGDPDYTVILTTGVDVDTGIVRVLSYDRGRLNPGETINRIFVHNDMYSPVETRVESVAYQRTLKYWIEQRQKKLRKYFPVIEVKNARISKADRIRGMQPFFANGVITLSTDSDELQRELLAFPAASGHDDIIDALSMQISFWNDTLSRMKQVTTRLAKEDPMSGESILAGLIGRSKKLNQYPYDVGMLGDTKEASFYRRVAV